MQPTRSPERSIGGRVRKTSVGRTTGDEGGAIARSRTGERVISGSASSSSATRYTSSSTTAVSSLSAARRAQHILGGEDRLILDLGARVSKVGHCGEARPRCMANSLTLATPIEHEVDSECQGRLYTLDICKSRDDMERRRNEYKLRSRIKLLLRNVLHHILLQDVKQRKIVIVENYFLPTIVKESMRSVLFDSLQLASVSFVPAALMSAVAIGRSSALTLDVGYEQSTLVPVHLWRPMTPRHVLTTARASMMLSRRLRGLLLKFGSYVAPVSRSNTVPSASTFAYMQSLGGSQARHKKIPIDLLDEDFLDEIKAKALLVLDRPIGEGKTGMASANGTFNEQRYPNEVDEDRDDNWMSLLEQRYGGATEIKDMVLEVPPERSSPLSSPTHPSTLGKSSQVVQTGRGAIIIPGWIRACSIEVFFEQGDMDAPSLTELVLNCLLQLPLDLRVTMASAIYVTGGTAMLPGFAHRLRLELVRSLSAAGRFAEIGEPTLLSLHTAKVGYYPNRKPLRKIEEPQSKQRQQARAEANEASMVDQTFVSAQGDNNEDESFVSTYESAESIEKSRTHKTGFSAVRRFTPIAGLLDHLAVVNDHAPRLDPETGMPLAGRAPAFPVNISSWLGASLTGSLRVDAVDQMQREQWTEQRERALAASRGDSDGDRPSLGLGRGSFLGSVSGLDLGTYGPLSGGARNRFSPHAAGSALRSPGATGTPRSPPPQ